MPSASNEIDCCNAEGSKILQFKKYSSEILLLSGFTSSNNIVILLKFLNQKVCYMLGLHRQY